jgi:alpha-beta hydrolase superfamily lysophospholipase
MTTYTALRLILTALIFAVFTPVRAAAPVRLAVDIRGQLQEVYYYASAVKPPAGRILFAPGDGGWRGFALTLAETAASWGYEVYGLDTKRYLESFTTSKGALRPEDVMTDMRMLAEKLRRSSGDRFVFAGWSEGAGLAVLAGGPEENKKTFRGIVAIGLTDSTVLGWRWTDNVTYVTKRAPDEPAVATASYLPKIAPLPFLQIQSSGDEYTSVPLSKKLFEAAREPKRFSLIQAQDHRFDGSQGEFFRALREGLNWMKGAGQ